MISAKFVLVKRNPWRKATNICKKSNFENFETTLYMKSVSMPVILKLFDKLLLNTLKCQINGKQNKISHLATIFLTSDQICLISSHHTDNLKPKYSYHEENHTESDLKVNKYA